MRELVGPLRELLATGRRAAWCSTIETRGSTPQKAGSTMLIVEDGRQFGTLGGGCVEADVRQAALAQMQSPTPCLVDRTLDSETSWADGLICGGRMKFVIQPFGGSDSESVAYFTALADVVESGDGGCELIVATEKSPLGMGVRVLVDGDSSLLASLHLPASVANDFLVAVPNLDDRPSAKVTGNFAVLPILPRCRLTIVGAGHVGQAVAELAAKVDFEIHIVDDREQFANRQRFGFAKSIHVGPFEQTLTNLPIGPRDYCLVMTRGHGHDAEALHRLVTKPARYVGLIGSRRKIRMILDDLERAGVPRSDLARVHAPLGIDIGSQSVMEIAVSIVAELIGHRNLGPDRFPPQPHFQDAAKT